MKELSIEEKAKRYDEAIEIAKEINNEQRAQPFNVMTKVFPELKESEDERIRKEMIEILRKEAQDFPSSVIAEKSNSWIAWLEKQGETSTEDFEEFINTLSKQFPVVSFAKLSRIAVRVKKWLERQGEKQDPQELFDTAKCQGYKEGLRDGRAEVWAQIEKQGEQKPFDYENANIQQRDFAPKSAMEAINEEKVDNQNCVKPDKVEPKFHEGEWLCENEPNNYTRFIQILEIVNVQGEDRYRISRDIHKDEDVVEFGFVEKYYHKFDIQDAKDGDVLACENGWTCIFKTLVNDETFSSYCFMDDTKWFCETGSEYHTLKEEFVKAYNGKIHPATKEQRDLLFQKMKEAGYEWNADEKKLKKIEQNPAWSEEDEAMWAEISDLLWEGYKQSGSKFSWDDIRNWVNPKLKSLKDRVQPKQEWSEEDESYLNTTIAYLKDAKEFKKTAENCINWLKSLKCRCFPQPKQELSEEDDTFFKAIIRDIENIQYISEDAKKKRIYWLKSLKDRVQQQPEWSEEDEYNIAFIVELLYGIEDSDKEYENKCRKTANWLKSLRPQSQWKPSDEQMKYLRHAADFFTESSTTGKFLESLYNNLKKLRKEEL